MDQKITKFEHDQQEQNYMLLALSERFNKLEAFIKEESKERIQDKEEIEEEAKGILAQYIEEARSRFNSDYERPEDEPPELDESDSRDRKVIKSMTNLANEFLESIVEYESSDDGEKSEEGSDAESQNSSDDSGENNQESSSEEEGENEIPMSRNSGQSGGRVYNSRFGAGY